MPVLPEYYAVAGLQLAGNYFAAENIRQTAELNRDIAEMNAQFAELDAYDAELAGYSEAAKYENVVDATLGRQKVIYAAQDIDIDYGTSAALVEESKFMAELNKMEIVNQAEAQALGFKREARNYRLGGFLEVANAEAKASSVELQGLTSAGRTGLSGYRRSYTPEK